MHLVVVQWHALINAQRNDWPRDIAAARQGTTHRRLVAFQRDSYACSLSFRQIIHIGVRVGLRLRGPRLLAREGIARKHGILLGRRELRAVVSILQNLHLAPLIQRVRAVRHSVGAAHGISVVAVAIGTVVPSSTRPRWRTRHESSYSA